MLDKIARSLFISRPVFWLVAPAAYLFGVASGGSDMTPLALFQAFLLTFPLGIYVFGINDIFDIRTDRANPRRKGLLWGARVSEGDRAWIFGASAIVIAAIMATAALSANYVQLMVMAFFLPFPYLYSAPPVRLKSRPVLDSISNATYTYGPYAMGFSVAGGLGFLDLNMILFALVFSAAHAIGTIMDIEGDRKAGIRTFAAVHGTSAPALFASAVLALNLPFLWHSMRSMFIVILVYLVASFFVVARPRPDAAKSAFIVMNISLAIWIAYAFCGYVLGLFEVV